MKDKLSFLQGIDFCVIIQILHIIYLGGLDGRQVPMNIMNQKDFMHTNHYHIRCLKAVARAILRFDGVMDIRTASHACHATHFKARGERKMWWAE